jgi:hypothetical protein
VHSNGPYPEQASPMPFFHPNSVFLCGLQMNLCGLQMEYHFNKITKLHAGGCGEAIIDMLSIELDCCYNTLQVAAVSHLYSLISGMPRLIGSVDADFFVFHCP